MVKNPAATAGDAGDVGLIPGQNVSWRKTSQTHSSVLAWNIPRTEEPGGLQSVGSQRVGHS